MGQNITRITRRHANRWVKKHLRPKGRPVAPTPNHRPRTISRFWCGHPACCAAPDPRTGGPCAPEANTPNSWRLAPHPAGKPRPGPRKMPHWLRRDRLPLRRRGRRASDGQAGPASRGDGQVVSLGDDTSTGRSKDWLGKRGIMPGVPGIGHRSLLGGRAGGISLKTTFEWVS